MENEILPIHSRGEFRAWLMEHASSEKECWLLLKKGRPQEDGKFYYLDAVEEALCFGWIDSTHRLVDGRDVQRFSPRKNASLWTELNKERVRRLERLGLMTDAGRAVLPPMGPRSFRIPHEIIEALKKSRAYSKFCSFPALYQRIRAYNVWFYHSWDLNLYQKALNHLIQETKKGHMYGEWNDYGRLLEE